MKRASAAAVGCVFAFLLMGSRCGRPDEGGGGGGGGEHVRPSDCVSWDATTGTCYQCDVVLATFPEVGGRSSGTSATARCESMPRSCGTTVSLTGGALVLERPGCREGSHAAAELVLSSGDQSATGRLEGHDNSPYSLGLQAAGLRIERSAGVDVVTAALTFTSGTDAFCTGANEGLTGGAWGGRVESAAVSIRSTCDAPSTAH